MAPETGGGYLNAYEHGSARGAAKQAVFDDFAEHVSRPKADFFERAGVDPVMDRREGPWFWDMDGRRFLDCHGNGGVFSLGHRHPAVLDAVRRALDILDIGNHHLVSGPRARLAKRLAELMPAPIRRTLFAAAGGEAVDAAIKAEVDRYYRTDAFIWKLFQLGRRLSRAR